MGMDAGIAGMTERTALSQGGGARMRVVYQRYSKAYVDQKQAAKAAHRGMWRGMFIARGLAEGGTVR